MDGDAVKVFFNGRDVGLKEAKDNGKKIKKILHERYRS
jgi:hypothetical protein